MKFSLIWMSLFLFAQFSVADQILCSSQEDLCVTYDLMESVQWRCRVDMINGAGNYCFNGSVESVADFIAKGRLNGTTTQGLNFSGVKIIDEDTIQYVGSDSVNFFSDTHLLVRCK